MSEGARRARVEEMVTTVKGDIQAMACAQRERAALTAAASRENGLVTVVVNADGTVIDARFASGIEELTYAEIAAAITAAAVEAAATVRRQGTDLMAAARRGDATLPELSEITAKLRDFPEIRDVLPGSPDSTGGSGSATAADAARPGPLEPSW